MKGKQNKIKTQCLTEVTTWRHSVLTNLKLQLLILKRPRNFCSIQRLFPPKVVGSVSRIPQAN